MKRETVVGVARLLFGIALALCLIAVGAGLVLAVQRAHAYPQSAMPVMTSSPTEAEVTLMTTPTLMESHVTIITTAVSSNALTISFRVRQIPGDYLFEVPVLAV